MPLLSIIQTGSIIAKPTVSTAHASQVGFHRDSISDLKFVNGLSKGYHCPCILMTGYKLSIGRLSGPRFRNETHIAAAYGAGLDPDKDICKTWFGRIDLFHL
jgi:hypothetical protein